MDGALEELLEKCMANVDTTLILNYMKLTDIPHDLLQLDMVKRLYMKQNLLKAVPLEIYFLGSLVSLYLDSNIIEYIPETIGDLSSLEFLGLNRNRITDLPTSIGKLSNLKSLQLSHNSLATLPQEIGNLRNLETLNLMSNEIKEIPNEISGCSNLKTLQLDCNQLVYINNGILLLQLLEDLSVSRNRLGYIPFDINFLRSLKELTVDANMFLGFLPGSILQSANLAYFGVHGCEKLKSFHSPEEHSLKLTAPVEVQWIGSESESVVPLRELCLREIGSLKKKNMMHSQTPYDLPTTLIKVLKTPIGSCTHCARLVYRAVFVMKLKASKILENYHFPINLKIIASVPKEALFIFIFCSLSCLQKYHREWKTLSHIDA